jgi:hypothetical protein
MNGLDWMCVADAGENRTDGRNDSFFRLTRAQLGIYVEQKLRTSHDGVVQQF